jgi:hypothetical protein
MFRTVFQKQFYFRNVQSILFPRKLASHFLIFDFLSLHYMLDPDPNPVPVLIRQKVTVPAFPVPASQHWDPHRRTK